MQKKYKIVLQQDQADCGVACLLSIIRFYEGNNTIENLRLLSGTNIQGTSLLGLFQAAKQLHFHAEAYESNLITLSQSKSPVILHVNLKNKSSHYLIFFGISKIGSNLRYIIGDPSKGVLYLKGEELDSIWQSKACLILKPNPQFLTQKNIQNLKIKWLISVIKKDTNLILLSFLLGLIIAALSVVLAKFSQQLIDNILPTKSFVRLNAAIVIVLILLIVKECFSFLRQRFINKQSFSFNVRVINFFFKHLLSLPKTFFEGRKIGDFTARLNDTERIQRVLNQILNNLLIDILMAIVLVFFIFSYSTQIGLICLSILPIMFLIINYFNFKVLRNQNEVMLHYASVESNFISTLQGIDAVKNYCKQDFYSSTNDKTYSNYQKVIYNSGLLKNKLTLIVNAITIFSIVLVLYFCSYQVLNNQMKLGQLVAITSLFTTLLPIIANLSLIVIPISEAKVALNRMFEFTLIQSEQNKPVKAVNNVTNILIKNISFRYTGRSKLFEALSLSINKGEIIAVLGDSGCGKSTLLQILQNNYQPEKGEIIVNDLINLADISINNWRKLLSVVPQEIHIFHGTILENIAFDDAFLNFNKVLAFVKEYAFDSFINSFPQSYNTIIGGNGFELSGGQKQIIGIARALYLRPQVLLLDEVTSALDRQSESFIISLLEKIKSEVAIVFITHRLHILKNFCNTIYILENGKIQSHGSHLELMKFDNLYSNYWKEVKF